MNAKPIHRSATREQQIVADAAFDEGREIGRTEMMAACIELLERHGHKLGAQRLREAKVIERTDNGKA